MLRETSISRWPICAFLSYSSSLGEQNFFMLSNTSINLKNYKVKYFLFCFEQRKNTYFELKNIFALQIMTSIFDWVSFSYFSQHFEIFSKLSIGTQHSNTGARMIGNDRNIIKRNCQKKIPNNFMLINSLEMTLHLITSRHKY